MGLKGDPLLGDLSQIGKAVDLKPAAVGEDGSFPAHEAVKTPEFLNQPVTGAQIEMIRVGEENAYPGLLQVFRGEGLDRPLGADRHKHGGFKTAMRRGDFTSSRSTGRTLMGDLELQSTYALDKRNLRW
jgi:hypothetical protein